MLGFKVKGKLYQCIGWLSLFHAKKKKEEEEEGAKINF